MELHMQTMNAQGYSVYATDGAMKKFDTWHKVRIKTSKHARALFLFLHHAEKNTFGVMIFGKNERMQLLYLVPGCVAESKVIQGTVCGSKNATACTLVPQKECRAIQNKRLCAYPMRCLCFADLSVQGVSPMAFSGKNALRSLHGKVGMLSCRHGLSKECSKDGSIC